MIFINRAFNKWILCLLILGIASCTQQKENNKIFTKASAVVSDTVKTWLSEDSNFVKPNYTTHFYENYDARLSANDINGAARILDAILLKHYNQYKNFDTLAQTANAFLAKYEPVISTEYAIALNWILGKPYLLDGKLDSALLYFRKAISYTANNYYGYTKLGAAYSGMVACYLEVGKPDSAFIYNNKALECYEKTDFKNDIPAIYNEMAFMYLFAGKYDEAIKSIDKALALCKANNSEENYHKYLFSKAAIYLENENDKYYPIADTLYHYFKDYNQALDLKIDAFQFYAEKFIGQKKYDSAKAILDSTAAFLVNASEDDYSPYNYYNSLSNYEVAIGKPISKRIFFEEDLKSTMAKKNYYYMISSVSLLRDDAKIRKDYKAAFEYETILGDAQDSLFSQQEKVLVLDLQTKYETEKKEQQIALQKSTIAKNRFEIIGLLAGLLAVTFGAILFLVYKKRKQAKLDIATQQQFTNNLMENTEDERKRIATELHDSISHELLNLKNNIKQGKPAQEQEVEKIVQSIREISRNLYPAMFEQVGLVASIEGLCERMTIAGLFTTCEITYNNQLNKRNELQLYRIIQEALTNTAKHAKADAAKITIESTGNDLRIEIKDNGVGFDTSEKLQNSKSFGLQSIYQRAKALGATSNLESSHSGTSLVLTTALY